jgi:hypothetical protein
VFCLGEYLLDLALGNFVGADGAGGVSPARQAFDEGVAHRDDSTLVYLRYLGREVNQLLAPADAGPVHPHDFEGADAGERAQQNPREPMLPGVRDENFEFLGLVGLDGFPGNLEFGDVLGLRGPVLGQVALGTGVPEQGHDLVPNVVQPARADVACVQETLDVRGGHLLDLQRDCGCEGDQVIFESVHVWR